jgi:hypothetical protein
MTDQTRAGRVGTFFHPDFTVGSGISPDHVRNQSALAGCTAGRELHPAPKVDIQLMRLYLFSFQASNGLSAGKS